MPLRYFRNMPLAELLYNFYRSCCSYIDSHRAYVAFAKEYNTFKKMTCSSGRFCIEWDDRHPCYDDKTGETGFDRHYVYHPAWAARILSQNKQEYHVDISSSVYFCSLVSAFLPVKFYDYRPIKLTLSSLVCETADLLALPFSDGSIRSISCMHVVEHVGLGRYGEPLDPDGDIKAIFELKRVLAPGGLLLFVVPVGGTSKIMFNAHRIYHYDQILDYFKELELKEFALIPDKQEYGDLVLNPPKELADAQDYGCGCFCFKKK